MSDITKIEFFNAKRRVDELALANKLNALTHSRPIIEFTRFTTILRKAKTTYPILLLISIAGLRLIRSNLYDYELSTASNLKCLRDSAVVYGHTFGKMCRVARTQVHESGGNS